MGFSTADQFNPTPMLMGGPAAYSPDQMTPNMDANQPMLMGGPAPYQPDQMNPGMTSPGMGGKGGVAGDPSMSAQQMNIPLTPVMNPPQTGLPGLPVPVAPMTPLGPSLGNPGGPGVQPQQQMAPPPPMPPVATPFRPNQQPRPNPFMQPNRMAPQMPQPGRLNMPLRGPMLMNRGGAGRGGMIR
jgi:hypothetical protein